MVEGPSWFAASGPGHFAIIEGTINSKVHQDILQENFRTVVHDFKLGNATRQ